LLFVCLWCAPSLRQTGKGALRGSISSEPFNPAPERKRLFAGCNYVSENLDEFQTPFQHYFCFSFSPVSQSNVTLPPLCILIYYSSFRFLYDHKPSTPALTAVPTDCFHYIIHYTSAVRHLFQFYSVGALRG